MKSYIVLSAIFYFVYCQDRSCDPGYECVSSSECSYYGEQSAILASYQKYSREYNELLRSLKKTVCNTELRKVCCESSTTAATTESSLKNEDQPDYYPTVADGDCGRSNTSESSTRFIRGGNSTNLGEHPWTVLIRRNRAGGVIWWHCGATLINRW